MKHAINVPSIFTGRRVRWAFELSAERQEIPVATPSSAPVVARRATRPRRIALVVAAGIVAALALARYVASGDKYEYADAYFASEAAATDRDSTAKPIASASALPSASATPLPAAVAPAAATPAAARPAAPAATAAVTPSVRPIAEKQTISGTPSPRPARRTNAVVAAAAAEATPATVVETHEPEEPAATAVTAGAAEIALPPAAPAAASVDEVTITGCLEIDNEDDRFRLADAEGAGAPKARSWRSGFLKKRAAAIDLVGSLDALSLHSQVGQRIAATGVLTSRTLKVSSVRTVSSSCN